MEPIRVTAVSAGLGRPSATRLLADRLARAAERRPADGERPVETRVVELRDLATDIAHNMVTGFPGPALREAIAAVTEADGLIAVTPVFTASYSGLFKSFFDVIDNTALRGRPVLLAATGGTPRHSLVLEHAMRPLFAYLGAVTVPTAVYAASEDWGGSGGPDGELAARIERAAGELADLARARPRTARPAGADGGEEPDADTVVPFEQQLASLGLD
ncbi:oxidoreductase [Streptomyces carminius]|uniref:Oxidoreductase n=1 Tax=Streptomyces carminius TaxID=2665496 RepID=A0A2M8LTJ7_9ACTN|nr:FMN reductase [Streptomyces carminius]PJE95277.1 oxidoreductase [Streptomyces carminius]